MTGTNGLKGLDAQMDDFGLDVRGRLRVEGIRLPDDELAALIQRMRESGLPASKAPATARASVR